MQTFREEFGASMDTLGTDWSAPLQTRILQKLRVLCPATASARPALGSGTAKSKASELRSAMGGGHDADGWLAAAAHDAQWATWSQAQGAELKTLRTRVNLGGDIAECRVVWSAARDLIHAVCGSSAPLDVTIFDCLGGKHGEVPPTCPLCMGPPHIQAPGQPPSLGFVYCPKFFEALKQRQVEGGLPPAVVRASDAGATNYAAYDKYAATRQGRAASPRLGRGAAAMRTLFGVGATDDEEALENDQH